MISLARATLASVRRAISSPVDVAEDGIDRGDDGDGVGHEALVHHVRQACRFTKLGARMWHAVRLGAEPSDTM